MNEKPKKNWIVIGFVILVVIGGGIGAFFMLRKNPSSPSEKSSGNPPSNQNPPDNPGNDNPQPNPGGKLSQAELEKYLLEKRLDLQKYFVFNLGNELILRKQSSPHYENECKMKDKLSQDLTKLTVQYEKKLEEAGYGLGLNKIVEGRNYGGRISKKFIYFLGKDVGVGDFDKEEWWGEKIDEKIASGKDKYVIFEKDDEPQKTFFSKSFVDSKGKIWFKYSNVVHLRMKAPSTYYCENKEKALEILKTDPVLEGKV